MEFKLPDIGEGVHEGEVVKWLVKVGDSIQSDQPMVEVMTDKATVEIPSPVTGVVQELCFKEGQTVEVGKVLLKIQEGKKGTAVAENKTSKPSPSPTPAAPVSRAGSTLTSQSELDEPLPFNILATPATRKLARDLKMDLRTVEGSGPNGRVTKEDVKSAYESGAGSPGVASAGTAKLATSTPAISMRSTPVVQKGTIQTIPLKGIRKKIAESMAHSKHTAAHFTYVEEADMTEIVRLRSSAAEEAKSRGVKLTFLPFIIKAVIPCLREFPYLNSSLDDAKQEIILKGDYNVGVATDTPNGLMVPVIKGADQKSIWELAAEIQTLSEKARAGRSSVEDLKGGTFTLTNAGSIGGVFATPVINHPEVAILGVNAIRKRPVVLNGEIVIRDMMFFSISVDHRVVDGADAARFMNRLIYFLQEPSRLVLA